MKSRQTYGNVTDGLLDAIGIDPVSHARFVAWALTEQLVAELARHLSVEPAHVEVPFWSRPDGLKRFRRMLIERTRRDWSPDDLEELYRRVRATLERHERAPISAGDRLRLLWTLPHRCVQCGRRPPAVKLHIDHVIPASRGGSSKYDNLQFLCEEDNLRKGNRLEEGEPWLNSV